MIVIIYSLACITKPIISKSTRQREWDLFRQIRWLYIITITDTWRKPRIKSITRYSDRIKAEINMVNRKIRTPWSRQKRNAPFFTVKITREIRSILNKIPIVIKIAFYEMWAFSMVIERNGTRWRKMFSKNIHFSFGRIKSAPSESNPVAGIPDTCAS